MTKRNWIGSSAIVLLAIVCVGLILMFGQKGSSQNAKQYLQSNDSSGFVNLTDVVPDAILEIRYFSTYNFVGERIRGYAKRRTLRQRVYG